MTLREIPYDVRQVIDWGLRALGALLGAVPRAFSDIWRFVIGSVQNAVAPVLPVLSQKDQELLVTTGIVIGAALAALLLVQTVMALVPRHKRATARPRQHRHRRAA
jgi:hypothetical protein